MPQRRKAQKEDPTKRKGQSLRSILGTTYKVIVKRDEDIILEIEDVKVEKKVRGVRIYLKTNMVVKYRKEKYYILSCRRRMDGFVFLLV